MVYIGIEPLHLSGPADLVLDNHAGGGNLLGFDGAIGIGAIASHEQACTYYRANRVYHLAQGMGAVLVSRQMASNLHFIK